MVGLLGLGNRHSPSAEARRSDASGSPRPTPSSTEQTLFASMNHNNTGGFFSLPHWTRRIIPTSSPARKSLAGLPHADANGTNLRNISLLLEKDLPPIPSTSANSNTTSHKPTDQPHDTQISVSIHHATDTPPQPAFYLDVYRNVPTTPPSQTNYTSFPRSSTENVLRKSKSTLSLRPEQHEQQRTRGVSMTQMLMKAKRTSALPTGNGNGPSTPLVRKSSFWSRKFSTSSRQHLTESPSLPVVKPTSPLQVDFTTTPPDSLARSRSNSIGARLSRRHSERANRRPPIARPDAPSLPQDPSSPGRINVRPSTAGPELLASHRSATRRPTTADSTIPSRSRSFFALSQHFTSPLSNSDSSVATSTSRFKSSPPNSRPRSSTNPPLLHRLSVNLFTSSSSSTKNGMSPTSRSPRPSLSQIPADVLKPRPTESSESFVNRLVSLVSKADIAGVLASAGDTIYVDSLKLFLERFAFHGDPLDVALRRLLMDIGLPRETQQIDRVIQAFANRYLLCNPDLFTSRDHPYILAFSLIMLHTDAFNKSNKRKMSKADYLKNTMLPGLIPEVLDCFYDNIVFAPFIFIEDPLDPEGHTEGPSTPSGLPSPMTQSGNTRLSRPKIDPYYLITNNLLDQLRVDVDGQISLENPFRWDGTGTSWDYDEILQAFAEGHEVQIISADMRSATPFFGLSVGAIPAPLVSGLDSVREATVSEPWTVRLTKVAVLSRKDDTGGKKPSNRKWRPYSVALTKSQLLLFRDLSWSATLLSWNDPPRKPPIPSTSFKPDEIISLNGALAVLDRSYSKHLNTFRLTTGDGRHMLFQTTEEKEMNEWISRVNYASAFKTTGICMRSLAMTRRVLELTGIAAATSHLHDLRVGQPRLLTWDRHNLTEPMDVLPGASRNNRADMNGLQSELAPISAPEVEGASQLKETFDMVKAELLTAARVSVGDISISDKPYPVDAESPRLASRSRAIHTRVEDLENRICVANAQINSNMHVARNIAILAPFQRSTRDRLQDTIRAISKKIFAMRLDVTKLICHRNILLNDLATEESHFKEATSLALQAATETLHRRYSEYTSQSSISSRGRQSKSSSHEEVVSTLSQSLDSPTNDSFRTALDFGPDWPSGEPFTTRALWGPSTTTGSPVAHGFDNSMGGYPSPDETPCLSLPTAHQSLLDTSWHGKQPVSPDFEEEQAEEWNKTRAAKRVSLVKLPSDLRITVLAPKPCGDGDGPFEEELPSAVDERLSYS